MSIEVYEVQSAALADGVYYCKKQQLLAAGWQAGHGDKFENYDDNIVEVLNLLENNTPADYTRALAAGDRIAAWEYRDCDGTVVRVGRPITPDVRMARTTEAAGASQQITCNLIANDGETVIESGLGSNIEVHFKPTKNSDLNDASPRFSAEEYLFGQWISGKWYYVAAPDSTEDCANPP